MDSSQYLPEGTLLRSGTYKIIKTLDQGGFGITYLAFDLRTQKTVAIKEFFPSAFCRRDKDKNNLISEGSESKEIVSRYKKKFFKEAQNIERLHHPNIIGILSAFEENNTVYYAMEFIGGGNLSDFIKQNGPLPYDVALEYLRQIVDALVYLHSKRMNHLDVKPSNVMLRDDGSVVLIDFGLSKQYDQKGDQTSTSPVGISHGYAPIEQYRCNGVSAFSPSTDVYSLGATFYYMLSGIIPPHATDLIDSELSFPSDIPEAFHGIIRKAMAPSRRDRYEDVASFYSDLLHPQYFELDATQIKPEVDETTCFETGQNYNHEENVIRLNQSKLTVEKAKRNRTWLMAAVIFSILIVACASLWSILTSRESKELIEKQDMARMDSVRIADSIAMLETERLVAQAALQDSIRQDSIKQENEKKAEIEKNNALISQCEEAVNQYKYYSDQFDYDEINGDLNKAINNSYDKYEKLYDRILKNLDNMTPEQINRVRRIEKKAKGGVIGLFRA